MRSIRNAKAEYKVEPGKKIPAMIKVQQRVDGVLGGTMVVFLLLEIKVVYVKK